MGALKLAHYHLPELKAGLCWPWTTVCTGFRIFNHKKWRGKRICWSETCIIVCVAHLNEDVLSWHRDDLDIQTNDVVELCCQDSTHVTNQRPRNVTLIAQSKGERPAPARPHQMELLVNGPAHFDCSKILTKI